jgi:hypothetical protein
MSPTIPDLWPVDLVTTRGPSPASILRQQGYLLGQKTRNFVVGQVNSSGSPDEFNHEFWVSAPLLNVRVRLCLVQHGVRFYPARVKAFHVIRTAPDHVPLERARYEATNLDQFTELIKSILAEEDVRELIQSLTDQSLDLHAEE